MEGDGRWFFVPFSSVEETWNALVSAGYIPDQEIATVIYLSEKLKRPILVEGPAGVGKTYLATALHRATSRPLIRLQCYEGLDESKSIYEWEYAKQLLYTQILREKIGEVLEGSETLKEAFDRISRYENLFFHERFLLKRPLLQAITSPEGAVLLIDEVDKADPEFEAFLLEVLDGFQISIPELGTYKAQVVPYVILTSNQTRELSDALRRRCLHLSLKYPDPEREKEILRLHIPDLLEELNDRIVSFLEEVRKLPLRHYPSISEAIDWAKSLLLLGHTLGNGDKEIPALSSLLKFPEDRKLVREKIGFFTPR
jgi:MoxR-like ATPase